MWFVTSGPTSTNTQQKVLSLKYIFFYESKLQNPS